MGDQLHHGVHLRWTPQGTHSGYGRTQVPSQTGRGEDGRIDPNRQKSAGRSQYSMVYLDGMLALLQ